MYLDKDKFLVIRSQENQKLSDTFLIRICITILQNNTKCVSSASRLAHARHVHQEVCSILLATYETLQSHLHEYMKLLPAWQQLKLETNDCLKRLNNLSDFAKVFEPSRLKSVIFYLQKRSRCFRRAIEILQIQGPILICQAIKPK